MRTRCLISLRLCTRSAGFALLLGLASAQAHAQAPVSTPPPAPATEARPAPSAPAAPAPTPQAAAPATAGGAPSPQTFTPTQSPLVVPPPPTASVLGPQQAPVYPPPYAPGTTVPGYGDPAASDAAGSARPFDSRLRLGAYEHDGFFLRLQVGVGAGGMTYREPLATDGSRAKVKTRGVIGSFELAIGGRVVENLILHGNLIAAGMGPNKTIDGLENNVYDDLATRMLLLGGGATYYVMPANLFITVVLGVSYLEERRDDDRTRSDSVAIESGAGTGTALSIGKEWWVGQRGQWGLGAAITGAFYVAPIEIALRDTWAKAHTVSLSFSATYN